jgi:hypothetical protein
VERVLGVAFTWFAFHGLAGSVVAVAIGAVLVGAEYRRRIVGLLGVTSHHVLDLLLVKRVRVLLRGTVAAHAVDPAAGGAVLEEGSLAGGGRGVLRRGGVVPAVPGYSTVVTARRRPRTYDTTPVGRGCGGRCR